MGCPPWPHQAHGHVLGGCSGWLPPPGRTWRERAKRPVSSCACVPRVSWLFVCASASAKPRAAGTQQHLHRPSHYCQPQTTTQAVATQLCGTAQNSTPSSSTQLIDLVRQHETDPVRMPGHPGHSMNDHVTSCSPPCPPPLGHASPSPPPPAAPTAHFWPRCRTGAHGRAGQGPWAQAQGSRQRLGGAGAHMREHTAHMRAQPGHPWGPSACVRPHLPPRWHARHASARLARCKLRMPLTGSQQMPPGAFTPSSPH